MEATAKQFLKEKYPESEHRFGFHSPDHNSVPHLHLHTIVLPTTSARFEKAYGTNLTTV